MTLFKRVLTRRTVGLISDKAKLYIAAKYDCKSVVEGFKLSATFTITTWTPFVTGVSNSYAKRNRIS